MNDSNARDDTRLWAAVRTPDDLGRFLARRRAAAGWTQHDLAEYLDIPPRYLHEIESGKHTRAYTRLFDLLRTLDIEARLEVVESGNRPPLDEATGREELDDETHVESAQHELAARELHVKPRADGRWSVVRGGATRATSVHDTKSQAQNRARNLARVGDGVVVIHGRDGRIQERAAYAPRSSDAFGFSESARRSAADFFTDFDEPTSSDTD